MHREGIKNIYYVLFKISLIIDLVHLGPVVSGCANKFGCRATTIAGAVFCAIAIFCSGYSNSLGVLIVSFGIFGGKFFVLNLFSLLLVSVQ